MTYVFPTVPETGSVDIFFWSDLVITPLFFAGLYKIGMTIYNKKYKNEQWGKYFLLALKIKFSCIILYWAVNKFYYKGGDTFVYYWHIMKLRQLLFSDPDLVYNIFFNTDEFFTKRFLMTYFPDAGSYLFSDSSYFVIFIGLLISPFCLFSYLNISCAYSLFALLGCWRLFKMFREMYPHLEREMAIACLFIPSVLYWGCGIMKDPLCLGLLGVFTHSTYELFFKRRGIIINPILIILCGYGLIQIKVYIILAFGPALAAWIFARYRYNIKSKFLNAIATPFLIILSVISGAFVLTIMGSYAQKYSFEQMMRTAQDTQNWLVYSSMLQGGSYYNLGDIEYTTSGLIKVFPKAVNVALFRPYIWEARKIMLIPAAIEGIVSMFLTIQLLLRTGIFRLLKMIISNPEVQFCLIFSIIFAFSVGFTSFNFGALARYKIPLMPFYYIALFILADTQKKTAAQVLKNQ